MPFSLLDMQIEYKENRDIQKIREASLAAEFYGVVESPVKGLICQFMAEVVSKTLEHNNADDQLFDYFTSLVGTISSSENISLTNENGKYYITISGISKSSEEIEIKVINKIDDERLYDDTEDRNNIFNIGNN